MNGFHLLADVFLVQIQEAVLQHGFQAENKRFFETRAKVDDAVFFFVKINQAVNMMFIGVAPVSKVVSMLTDMVGKLVTTLG